jgi:gliding motility-associated-like protein
MVYKIKHLITLCVLFISTNLLGQKYFLDQLNGQTITTCRGIITTKESTTCTYTNSAGQQKPTYCDNDNYTVTFYSGSPTEQLYLNINKVNFKTELGKDILYIYNGPTTASPLLVALSGNPGTQRIVSTGGYLTLRFVANSSDHDYFGAKILLGCEPEPCNNNPVPSDECSSAPTICTYTEYCGVSSGYYTEDHSAQLLASGFVFGGSQTIENNSWIKFVANATVAEFQVTVYQCDRPQLGMDGGIFASADCNTFDLVSNSVSQGTGVNSVPGPPLNGSATMTLKTNQPLTIGETYYLMLDGFGGSICNYTIKPISGLKAVKITATDLTPCQYEQTTLSVMDYIPGSTFKWYKDNNYSNVLGTAPTLNVSLAVNTIFECEIKQPAAECPSLLMPITISVLPLPQVSAGKDTALTCTNTAGITLKGTSTTGGGGLNYVWTSPGGSTTSGNNLANVTTTGTYILTITQASSGCSNRDTVVVTENKTPPIAKAGIDTAITCTNLALRLDGTTSSPAGVTYSWSGPAITNVTKTQANPLINQAGTYTLEVKSPINGCTATDDVVVKDRTTKPTANAGVDTSLTCTRTSLQLKGTSDLSSNVSYTWSTGSGGIVSGGNTATPTINKLGNYSLVVTNLLTGCSSAADVVAVSSNTTKPDAQAGSTKTLTCKNLTVTLDGASTTSNVSYLWAGPSGASIVNPNTATPIVNKIGTYTLTVTDKNNGCTSSATVTVNEDKTVPTALAGEDKLITCTTTTVDLNGNSNPSTDVTYEWSGPGITGSFIGQNLTGVTQTGTFNLKVTKNSNGCSASDAAIVTKNITTPSANAGASKTLTCVVTQVQLSALGTTNAIYSWTGPGIVSGDNTLSPIVNVPGTYTLTVTDNVNGCTKTSTTTVTENKTPPTVSIITNKDAFCPGDFVTITATTGFAGYQWYKDDVLIGSSGQNTLKVYEAGTYHVSVVNTSNGCIGESNKKIISASIQPVVTLSSDDDPNICSSGNITLETETINENIIWYINGTVIPNASASEYVASVQGAYSVSAANNAGCRDTSNFILLTVDPDFVLDLGESRRICEDEIVTLDATVTNADSYLWSNAATSPTIDVVNEEGIYSVTVTRGRCEHSDTVEVTIDSLPSWYLGDDKILCIEEKNFKLLGPVDDFTEFYWENGTQTNPRPITSAGEYIIILSNKCGTTYDTINITTDTCKCYVFVPNAFTPNGDKLNSYFRVESICDSPVALNIYNRWGQLIYSGSDSDLGWDGTFNGNIQPQDTYIYTAEYYDSYFSKNIVLKGSLILLR